MENRSRTPTSVYTIYKIPFFTSLLVAALAVVVDRLVITPVLLKRGHYGDVSETSSRYDVVDEEVVSLFVTYDENLDGLLDLSEFVKVANRILHRKVSAYVFSFLYMNMSIFLLQISTLIPNIVRWVRRFFVSCFL